MCGLRHTVLLNQQQQVRTWAVKASVKAPPSAEERSSSPEGAPRPDGKHLRGLPGGTSTHFQRNPRCPRGFFLKVREPPASRAHAPANPSVWDLFREHSGGGGRERGHPWGRRSSAEMSCGLSHLTPPCQPSLHICCVFSCKSDPLKTRRYRKSSKYVIR